MIEIIYSLHPDEGGPSVDATIRGEHVPRLGELVAFDDHSYQVVDVLWNLRESGGTYVTVQAFERNWHKHFDQVATEWRRQHRNEPA